MLSNYFTIALRNLKKNASFTTINMLGLALSLTCCLLIFLILRFEASFDHFFAKGEQIYRVVTLSKTENEQNYLSKTPYPLAKALRSDFPELEKVTQIHYDLFGGLVTIDKDRYSESKIVYADSLFLSVFEYKWISGDAKQALTEPNSVVLTESLAKKYFKGQQALGKIIEFNSSLLLKVTGVIENIPNNTHLPFSMLISFSAYKDRDMHMWGYTNQGYTYVVLPKIVSNKSINNKLPGFLSKHIPEEGTKGLTFELQPLFDIRFDTRFATSNPTATVSKEMLWTLGFIGVLIVLIACANFINLSTAQAIKRGREVGMRKVLGSTKEQVIFQFLSESILLTSFAVFLSIIFTYLLIPKLNAYIEFTEIHFSLDLSLILFLLSITLMVGIVAGLYPAMILAKFKPILALKNNISSLTIGKSYFSLGKGMVIFQFVAAQVLIIATLVVSQQMEYFQNKDLGFNKEAIVNFYLPSQDIQKLALIRNRILEHPQIKSVAYGKGAPTSNDIFGTGFNMEGKEGFGISVKSADEFYLETYGLTLLAGNWLPQRVADKSPHKFVVNETMLKKMGYNVLGKNISIRLWDKFDGVIVGVVKDFHLTSLKEEIAPLVIMNLPEAYSQAGIKLSAQNVKESLLHIEKVYKDVFAQSSFSYSFLNEEIAKLYVREEKIQTLFKYFAGAAIFIACLGLFGLTSYTVIRRTKEIAVRKVLGASVTQIVILLYKEFAILVIIAFLIASPLSWYLMNGWLEGFAYSIKIGIGTMATAGMIALLVAFSTISFHAIKSALANPIKSLLNESR
jgi:ABC-type antimicrobial peptide transport system permease subunit